jgi:uncharacterized protein (TIGR03083 family)
MMLGRRYRSAMELQGTGRIELDAFAQEAAAVESSLARVPAAAWPRPALGVWTLGQLTAHLVRAATRIDAYLDRPPSASVPACDRVGYFRFDAAGEADAVAERARAYAQSVEPERLVEDFAAGWRRSLERARGRRSDDLVETVRGPMTLDEYAATRVLELVVHHIDVRSALDLPAAATPVARRLTVGILEALLDGPRPRNLGAVRFIRAATGRVAADDPRLPVLR